MNLREDNNPRQGYSKRRRDDISEIEYLTIPHRSTRAVDDTHFSRHSEIEDRDRWRGDLDLRRWG